MSLLSYIIIYSLAGGLLSLSFALILLFKKQFAKKLAYYATPFAAGALLAAVFLDLLPEGVHETSAEDVFLAALAGILLFFIAERFLRWFHHHHQHENTDPAVPLIVAGDTMHNALDGVAIAAAFLVSVPTGIITTFAVAAHEIPQEIGDFGLLLKKGVRRRKVALLNVMSSLATLVAAVITYIVGSSEQLPLGILLGLSAGFLLYIALSDIIPDLHENQDVKRLLDWQPVMLMLGIIIVSTSIMLAHSFIETRHDSLTKGIQHSDHEHQECQELIRNYPENSYDAVRGITRQEADCIDKVLQQ
jgi:zinc and cadmium transporter